MRVIGAIYALALILALPFAPPANWPVLVLLGLGSVMVAARG